MHIPALYVILLGHLMRSLLAKDLLGTTDDIWIYKSYCDTIILNGRVHAFRFKRHPYSYHSQEGETRLYTLMSDGPDSSNYTVAIQGEGHLKGLTRLIHGTMTLTPTANGGLFPVGLRMHFFAQRNLAQLFVTKTPMVKSKFRDKYCYLFANVHRFVERLRGARFVMKRAKQDVEDYLFTHDYTAYHKGKVQQVRVRLNHQDPEFVELSISPGLRYRPRRANYLNVYAVNDTPDNRVKHLQPDADDPWVNVDRFEIIHRVPVDSLYPPDPW